MPRDDFNPERLGRSLFHMTWPMLFGVLSLMSFQLADSAFIGQLGVEPLAALGFSMPIHQLTIGAQVGLGIATTALISRTLGAGNPDRARRLAGLVVITGTLLMLVLTMALWLLQAPLMRLLGAEPELLPIIRAYWAPWLLSIWMGALLYFGYSICRSHGDTRLPGLAMGLTSLLNLALDPLFIFTFGWGMPGAAWATVAAFGIGLLWIYQKLFRRHWLDFNLGPLNPLNALGQLSRTMTPAMLSQLAPALSASLATALMAGFGAAAVAAWGLGTRLEFFSIVIVLALTMSLPPMVGRLLGAGDVELIQRLVNMALKFVLIWQLAVTILWLLLSGVLSRLLTQDESVAMILRDYLLRVPLSYGALGVTMVLVSVCNALGMPMRGLLISLLRLFACYLPALWIGAQLGGVTGLLTGALVGNIAAGLTAWALYRQGMARMTRLVEVNRSSVTG